MMANIGFPEVMASFGVAVVVVVAVLVLGWIGYCITSIARAADALERIADALENDEDDEGEDTKKEGGAK